MRIIAGTARGVRLAQPTGRDIRPTLDRVREALFSILGPAIGGCRFLDLYSGTGANGLEALSRGAAHADLVEADKIARVLISENVAKTKLSEHARIHALTLPEGLSRLPHDAPYEFVYADPPHAYTDYAALLGAIEANALLAQGGIVVLEHATRTPVPGEVGAFQRTRAVTYGGTTLSFFRALAEMPVEHEAA
jgi:16S rRNA (guanine966-N2)-methyltransferase